MRLINNKGMHIKTVYSIIIIVLFCFFGNAQTKVDTLSINFKLEFNKEPLVFYKQYITSNRDTLVFENFKCYISSVQIFYTDSTIFQQKHSYHLLDFDNTSSFIIPINNLNDKLISKVRFNIGIDSLTNTSGALSDDLDPINGMYWAWQSGYINLKIEGKSPSCKTRMNEFHFHIGGYLHPFNTMRTVELIYNKKEDQINIVMDLNKFFSNIYLAETNSIMIPGKKAMDLADYSTKLFYIE